MAGASANHQPAAGHQASRLDADIARDLDLARRQAGADPVEPVAGAFDADVLRVAHAQPKGIADGHALARRLQLDPRDLVRALAGEKMRHQRRQVEPLRGALVQRQNERRHGSRSLR